MVCYRIKLQLTQPTCGERTHFSRQTGGWAGVYCFKDGNNLKGQYVVKTRAAQEEKKTTHNIKNFVKAEYTDIRIGPILLADSYNGLIK